MTSLNESQAFSLQAAIREQGLRGLSRAIGVKPATLSRALRGQPLSNATLSLLARVPPRVRTADEFKNAGRTVTTAPRRKQGAYSWDLAKIRAARDAQLLGKFDLPVRLSESMTTDDAIFVARNNRLAPQNAIEAKLVPCPGARGEAVAKRVVGSVFAPRAVVSGLHLALVDHGIAIGHIARETNAGGTQVDLRLEEWPLEYVTWNASREVLQTPTADGRTIDIVHGDSEWIVFRKYKVAPWTREACVLPASFIWAAHAEGISDWAGATRAHGLSQVIGKMPQDYDLLDEDGNLSKRAQAFLNLLRDIVSGETGAGLIPYGAEADFISNASTAHQIFLDLIANREKAAARVYTGTDAALGSVGGAPGVDIAALFGVATTRIQGDLEAIETGLNTGLYEPWAAINEGSSRYAPTIKYQIPDPDAASKRDERSKNYQNFLGVIKGMRDQKLEVTQDTVAKLAAEFAIDPVPTMAAADNAVSAIVLAPTDMAKIVKVRHALSSNGIPLFGDARDDMTITELDAYNQRKNQIAIDQANATAQAQAQATATP